MVKQWRCLLRAQIGHMWLDILIPLAIRVLFLCIWVFKNPYLICCPVSVDSQQIMVSRILLADVTWGWLGLCFCFGIMPGRVFGRFPKSLQTFCVLLLLGHVVGIHHYSRWADVPFVTNATPLGSFGTSGFTNPVRVQTKHDSCYESH